ncbi:hypothetical protein SAMN05444274_11915 [Mariniphaga anaerophila]|uniref:Uncharacterized protein n=1 Tax=Mariniphaga anaerophila TaxID=1484053 RepID=A0A1M5GCR9_9BACT|nr:DUF6057 family protein [Mariniphaga anaerophila]SHG01514.1 hypothetical protein SAMN05444274_11915 [Mariniphaga anaerophila]
MKTNGKTLAISALTLVFVLHLFYFAVLNRFHLWNFEQIQFFRFSTGYFSSFLSDPGGFTNYIGVFFIQFFHFPFWGALILSLLAVAVFFVSRIIFRKLRFNGILFPLLPVFILTIVQSNYHYSPIYTFHFLNAIGAFALYVSIQSAKRRYAVFPAVQIVLFLLSGIYSVLFLVLCFFYELLFQRTTLSKWAVSVYVMFSVVLYFFVYRFFYTLPFKPEAVLPEVFFVQPLKKYLVALLAYFPLMLIVVRSISQKKNALLARWNFVNIAAGGLVALLVVFSIATRHYNKKRELIFKMDYNVQQQNWDEVLRTAQKYPGVNQLVVYFTNLALSQKHELAEKLFAYPQLGKKGLRLKWERNKVAPFYGGEVFYYLQNDNEAFRWAFESMVSNGLHPRGLKRLVNTSIANGHLLLAEKYLTIIEESLFYKSWATDKRRNIAVLLQSAGAKADNPLCKISADFTADLKEFDLNLASLLENCPENSTALGYYMATLLFEKNVREIWAQVAARQNFEGHEIPTLLEEALLIYMNNTGERFIDGGLKIREETYQRFERFAMTFARNRQQAARVLEKDFGDTFWYYFYFVQ